MQLSIKLALIITALFFFTNQANAKIHNKYEEIAAKYHIHPFNLDYGYPVRYKWAERPIAGVIYLTDDFDYYEELSPQVYLAEPTVKDAELITKSYVNKSDFPKYYLAVDNTVKMADLIVFIDGLMKNQLEMEICFVGGNGRYVSVNYDNWNRMYDPSVIACFPFINTFKVMLNSNDELWAKDGLAEIDSLHSFIEHAYMANVYTDDQDYNEFNYAKWNKEIVDERLKRIKTEQNRDPGNMFFSSEIDRYEHISRLVNQFKGIAEPPSNFFVLLEKQKGTSLEAWYSALDQIQYGVHLARASYFKKRFNGNYLELFYGHDPIYLDLLEFTFPDRLMEKEGYSHEPPAPTEIIDGAPKPPQLEPISIFIEPIEEEVAIPLDTL